MMETIEALSRFSLAIGLVLYFPVMAVLVRRVTKYINSEPQKKHTHVFDIERTRLSQTRDGELYGECAVKGCHAQFYIGKNIAAEPRQDGISMRIV